MTARTGMLRHRIILESAAVTPDGGGGESLVWQPVATLWAAIRPLSGRERFSAGEFSAQVSHEIILRYRAGVLPAMRFRKGSRIFEIRAVMDENERRRRLRVLCEEQAL